MSSRRLLIVEDSVDLRDLLFQLFTMEGYEVLQAGNGHDALVLLRAATELPQLILLDLMMPIMDGFEFRKEQIADARLAGIPVLIMTADGETRAKQVRAGAVDALRKPVELEHLLDTVDRVVRHSDAQPPPQPRH